MELNWYILFITAIIPLAVGAVWYNPKVFGNVWMRSAGLTEEQASSGNMFLIFGLIYLFGLFIGVTLFGMVIHQYGFMQSIQGVPGLGEAGSEIQNYFDAYLAEHGGNFRSFKHGALHGGMATVTFALPIIAIVALFERRGWKYIWVHFGYWFVTLLLMGGVICCCM